VPSFPTRRSSELVGSFVRSSGTSSAIGRFRGSRTTTSRSRSAVSGCPPGPESRRIQAEAAVGREVLEETGVNARIVGSLGVERYDVWPSEPEVHERHFFQLEPLNDGHGERWSAGEGDPSDDGSAQRWTCQWIPLEQAHVL